jgi:hypothetical protein
MQALKALVIVLGLLIFVAFGFLAYGVATKFDTGPGKVKVSGSFGESQVDMPAGAQVLETSLGDGRIVVRIAKPDGEQALILIDPASGGRAGIVHLKPAPAP